MQYYATTKDSRIAQYSFGRIISQFGVTVFSCTSARNGKKIFGNDPDPTTEIILDSTDDIVTEHIKSNPNGKVADMRILYGSVAIHIKFTTEQCHLAAHGRVTH